MSITQPKNLREKVKKLPLTPGVYLFIGGNNEVLYVGRATSLRRRVAQYFNPSTSTGRDIRIQEMVSLAKNIKFYRTDTVLEAIILEANLIKKYWAKYNVKDRDDRSFIYIIIPKGRGMTRIGTRNDGENIKNEWMRKFNFDYPAPVIIRGRQLAKFQIPNSKFHLFGPYQSLTVIKNALKIIRRVFPYSTCLSSTRGTTRARTQNAAEKLKPCFDYQIGLCPGACVGAISSKDYKKNINDLVLFLSGKKKQLLKRLQKENPEKIQALKHIQDVALIANEAQSAGGDLGLERIEGYDISHLSGKETYGSMVVFTNNQPDKDEYRLFKIKRAPASDDLKALAEVIERRFNHPEWRTPDLIMIDGGGPQISYITKIMQDRHINVSIVGISKYGGDELVFPLKTNKSARELIQNIRGVLLRVRDEAHRVAKKSSVSRRRIK